MIIRWGRKGLVAAAFAVAFVTPTGGAAPTTTIHKVDLHPSYKQVVRHVTPSEGITEIKDGVHRGYQIQEEDELLAMIAMAFIEMVE